MLVVESAMEKDGTYNLRIFIFVRVRLHVPDDLMCKELRELGSLDDESLHVSKHIVSKRLHNLWNVEKGHVDRV